MPPSPHVAAPALLADIGGTNARFALLRDGTVGPISVRSVADYPTIEEAVAAYLESEGGIAPRAATLAVAGAVVDGHSEPVNSDWVIDARALASRFGWARIDLINDFAAVAWALPELAPADLAPIGGGTAQPGAPMVVLGAGTGLGVAMYVPTDHGGLVLATEGGHADLAAGDRRQAAVIEQLRNKFGRVSIERALSGPGLENLYGALAQIDQVSVPVRTAAEIVAAALDASCPVCRASLDMFCALLGAVAGDLALTAGAQGGVLIAGGIVPRFVPFLRASDFRRRFEAKGRLGGLVRKIPTQVILRPDVAFLGLAALQRRGATG